MPRQSALHGSRMEIAGKQMYGKAAMTWVPTSARSGSYF
ncbi:hypothetical protein EV02_1313 [Prochlorococcus marinus str. SB]|uniref:Uncharacterized protein n=1 Tax=Prochlorococcus marinus str. SB TaxID=59926 RepID=A0A0A2B792_PROMR|nr:hypothetical protein EV02_1313 [Prochlorococcus marinus str. SB]